MFGISVNAGASGIKIHLTLVAFVYEFQEMTQSILRNSVIIYYQLRNRVNKS